MFRVEIGLSMASRGHAVIVLAIDGVTTRECGIGVAVSQYFKAYDAVLAAAGISAAEPISLFAIGPRVAETSPDYRPDLVREISALCHRTGGSLGTYPVPDDASLKAAWGLASPAKWEQACVESSALISGIAQRFERVTVMVHGIMLANLRSYVQEDDSVRLFFVAHSLGMAGNDKLAEQRVAWETAGFGAMCRTPGDKVAYVSMFTRSLLADSYGIPDDRLIPFLNGIWADDPKYRTDTARSQQVLDQYGIPAGRDLVFSWGRCVPSKGFDLILDGWGEYQRQCPERTEHLVLLMPSAVAPADHVAELRKRCDNLGPQSVTPVFDFSDELPAAMLASARLRGLVFASEFESYMLTAAEAIKFSAPSVQHVYYDIPPVREQYEGMPNSHAFTDRTPGDLAKTLEAALSCGASGTKEPPSFVAEAGRFTQACLTSIGTRAGTSRGAEPSPGPGPGPRPGTSTSTCTSTSIGT
ncbi:glycosyltransferase family protein [Streptomyces varsoviensis]|uniref:hypothetical protein n=1 Tax=Streptomyces varsoviensis TaxID=67373 RepID=UPI001B806C91|nr:hypothetical protein [Streptomyces varsoviensis]